MTMEPRVDLRSDTVTTPSPEMRRAIHDAPVGDDVYGDDPSVNELEDKAAKMLGKEAGLFVTSGTQGNLVSMLAHCERGDEVLVGDRSHIFSSEAGGASVLGGLFLYPIKTDRFGFLEPDIIHQATNPPGLPRPANQTALHRKHPQPVQRTTPDRRPDQSHGRRRKSRRNERAHRRRKTLQRRHRPQHRPRRPRRTRRLRHILPIQRPRLPHRKRRRRIPRLHTPRPTLAKNARRRNATSRNRRIRRNLRTRQHDPETPRRPPKRQKNSHKDSPNSPASP